jgi:hypothetical protein
MSRDTSPSTHTLAGPDGRRISTLFSAAQSAGVAKLSDIMTGAMNRLFLHGDHPSPEYIPSSGILNAAELNELAEMFAGSTSVANLLGRSRVVERAHLAIHHEIGLGGGGYSGEVSMHADSGDDADSGDSEGVQSFAMFADGDSPAPLAPKKAVEFFRSLVPGLKIDPATFDHRQRLQGFNIAATTNQQLTESVKRIISDVIEGNDGGDIANGPGAIRQILEDAGVSPLNPQYANMVMRTNLNGAYTQGTDDELEQPHMQEMFPAWQYVGIRDGRQGSDHEPHFDRYFPVTLSFAEVRGERVYNCRCSKIPVDRYQWTRLVEGGARIERMTEQMWRAWCERVLA